MTREEAIKALIKERKTSLHENKQAFDMAIKALQNQPKFIIHSDGTIEQIIEPCEDCIISRVKEIYNKGWKDGAEATAYHVELCEEENPTIPLSVIEDIKANIKLAKYASKDIPERALIYSNGWDDALDVAIDVIDKHIAERGSE